MKDSLRVTLVITGTIALAAVVSAAAPADAQEAPLVQFIGGIGVNPVSNVAVSGATTTVTANVVRGVAPGGLIWVIRSLDAKVDVAGHISVLGTGLLLAGGDVIGTTGGQSVFATLFCGPAASATASSSTATGVALDSTGDFLINDVLTPVPPNPCANPVLLIRSATVASHPWFAAGVEE
jgi:hypothetical protein